MEWRELNSCGSGLGHVVSTTVTLCDAQNVWSFSASQGCRLVRSYKVLCFMELVS